MWITVPKGAYRVHVSLSKRQFDVNAQSHPGLVSPHFKVVYPERLLVVTVIVRKTLHQGWLTFPPNYSFEI